MKKILVFFAAICVFAACYDDYTMDYDYTGAFITYQYDLRTFVYGEDNDVSFTVCLGGTVNNDRDRRYDVSIDNSLLTADLSKFDETGEIASFKAIDGMLGNAELGTLSNGYVTNEVKAAGITELNALPEDYYTVLIDGGMAIKKGQRIHSLHQGPIEGVEGLAIRRGRHTAEIAIKPTEKLFADEKALKPYYALGLVINDADVDSLFVDKSFQIMAVKVENKFYGNWYHGGRVQVRKNKDGELISDNYKSILIPQSNNNVCALTTTGINTSVTDKFDHGAGSLKLTFNEDNTIGVEDAAGTVEIRPIPGQPSHFNGETLLQNREIYLNYAYSNGNGTTTYVTDTLKFRNRIRDGFNEWQDENPENYK